ncbi:TetR family transcriptional regulator [Paenibacillus filicis]|uniref:TetR family transcriptional regulator n=1 Tax=Paenibacillus gyeongsangnamensis TaxID=3388067 RepID=A0ABT4QES4_9BACL|nr:TetR family transcriptional regulator [Paenibacillus filicis]MCZ8515382.1 TetR family transcriptional regulator [Paenibacillus filicis]
MARTSVKKEAILQAALELFAEKGFSATATKEIAERSGTAEGLLFYYFKDKRELLMQVVRTFSFHHAIQEKESALDRLDAESALMEYGRAYLSFLREHRSYLLLIWSPELMADNEISKEVAGLVERIVSGAARLLERAARNKPVSPQSLEAAAGMMLSSLLTYSAVGIRLGGRALERDDIFVR